jgi:4'-phosphopantetheinyl transferase EntD
VAEEDIYSLKERGFKGWCPHVTREYNFLAFQITLTQTEKQDTSGLYDKMTLLELQQKVPEINWIRYFNGLVKEELDENEKVVLFALKYFKKLGKLLTSTSKRYSLRKYFCVQKFT